MIMLATRRSIWLSHRRPLSSKIWCCHPYMETRSCKANIFVHKVRDRFVESRQGLDGAQLKDASTWPASRSPAMIARPLLHQVRMLGLGVQNRWHQVNALFPLEAPLPCGNIHWLRTFNSLRTALQSLQHAFWSPCAPGFVIAQHRLFELRVGCPLNDGDLRFLSKLLSAAIFKGCDLQS